MRSYDLDRVREAAEETGAEVAALQLPEGLKRRAGDYAAELRALGLDVVVSGDPCFGACDPATPDLRAVGVDLVVHVGHTSMEVDSLPTVHVPLDAGVDVEPVVREAAGELGDRVGLITTAQHLSALDEIVETLKGEGVEPEVADAGRRNTAPGQVLGCDLGNARVDAPEILYVGTGIFHPVGAALATGKRVLAADPYTSRVREASEKAESFVRSRFGAVARAASAERWGVLVGRKPGQRRVSKAREAASTLREEGREALLVTLDLVTPETLQNLGMDAYVNTACPRLSLEDSGRYDAPVLTPPELELVLGDRDEYVFDEFEQQRQG